MQGTWPPAARQHSRYEHLPPSQSGCGRKTEELETSWVQLHVLLLPIMPWAPPVSPLCDHPHPKPHGVYLPPLANSAPPHRFSPSQMVPVCASWASQLLPSKPMAMRVSPGFGQLQSKSGSTPPSPDLWVLFFLMSVTLVRQFEKLSLHTYC